MPGTTYHLLTEAEPFSEFDGGAISRWTANIVRNTPRCVVVCPSADSTWGFAPESVCVLGRMRFYKHARRGLSSRTWLFHCKLIRWIFRPLLERLRPGDLVWIHNRPEFAIALTSMVEEIGARVVLHLHNSHLSDGPEQLMREVRVSMLVFASRYLLDQARDRFPSLGPSCVLYSGADESIFYPAANARHREGWPTVLFAGRLVENKGVHVLLDAMRLLQQQTVPLQANIVGSSNFGAGAETAYIRRLKTASPATVSFLPYRSGVALGELFREADIFCSPAVWDEPFGLVNVEALASGLPVVSTRSGGASEIFAGGGGILVERGSATHLASALRRLAENPILRTDLGKQGYRAFLERFTWSRARTQVQHIQEIHYQ